jgi:hypothetical protein
VRGAAIAGAALALIAGLALTAGPAVATGVQLTWSPLPANSGPPPLSFASAAYDSDNNTLVVFGGVKADGSFSNDTYVWDGSTWTSYPGAQFPAPPKREKASLAFDPQLHQLILFGGEGPDHKGLGDTWAWNGISWYEELLQESAPIPAPRYGASFSYDGSGDLVLFGGVSNPAWASASTTTTSSTSTSSTSTSTTTAPGHPIDLKDTWLWTSGGWVPSNAEGPSGRDGAVMAWDSTSHQVVLFGGNRAGSALADTWVWSQSRWAKQAPSFVPPARSYAAAFDEPAAKVLAVFGGGLGRAFLDDTWEWTGTTWAPASVHGTPPARNGAAAAFLSSLNEGVVLGGVTASGLGDNWILTHGSTPPTTTTTSTSSSLPPTNGTGPTTQAPPSSSTSTTRPVSPTAITIPRSRVAGLSQRWLSASPNSVHRGERIVLTGSGFKPGSEVTITFHSAPVQEAPAYVGAYGTFNAEVAVPSTADGGTHHFEASGVTPNGQTTEVSAAVHVAGPVPGPVTTATEKLVLVSVAILLPVAAWLAMSTAGLLHRWRRSR